MIPVRLALVAGVAALLLATLPVAGAEEQYPRGLMSATPTTPGGGRTCIIDVRPVAFGSYDTLSGTEVDALGYVIYTCGNLSERTPGNGGGGGGNNAIRVELEPGLAMTFDRSMGSGTGIDHLLYNLYLDATHRTIWGNGFAGTDVYVDSSPPNRTPVTVPIFGRIRALQDVPAGNYYDSLLARIVF